MARSRREEPVAPVYPAAVATSLLTVAIMLVGVIAYQFLQISALPQVGRGPGVPIIAREPTVPHLRGGGDRLHRARRALRELHPPDHHPPDASLGWHRRAAGANHRARRLTIVAIIGIVLLIGIVKKNAIMMIDFAPDAEREEGKPPRGAIHQASLLRLRPILMTTMAAILGALPLRRRTGMGSELRHPLRITVGGGLIVSQFLTLFTTQVIYLAFDRFRL